MSRTIPDAAAGAAAPSTRAMAAGASAGAAAALSAPLGVRNRLPVHMASTATAASERLFALRTRRSAGFFAAAILHYGRETIHRWRPDALVPVPVHKTRLADRGYNQAFLIAKELSARTGIPVREDLIARIKKTAAQKELTFEERRRNIQDAFACSGNEKAPSIVVVVDDIFTTGSTLGTIASILKEQGAEKVYGACVSS